MVKEVEIDYPLENCTPKAFFEAVYAKTASTEKYHRVVYGTEGVDVSEWEGGKRRVVCSMPLSLPEAVKSMIGGDSIPIIDLQCVTFHTNGDFVVDSAPAIQIRGGSGYKTIAQVSVKAKSSGGLMVHALVTCSAAGPWGMIGFIEGIMAEQAKTGMMQFLDFCKGEVIGNPPLRESLMPRRRSDDYFDTQDAVSESSFADGSVYSAQSRTGGAGTNGSVGVLDLMQQLVNKSEEIQRNLKSLSQKVDKIKQTQSKLLWKDVALTVSAGLLLWMQFRRRS